MNALPAQLIPPTVLSEGQQSHFTATALTRVDKLTFSNDTGGAAVVASYVVPSGFAANAQTLITPSGAVADGAVLIDTNIIGHVLNVGDQLVLSTDTDGVIAMCSGVTFQ